MVTTMMDFVLAEGQRRLLRVQLEEKFGPLSETVLERLEKWPREKLIDLGRALVKAQTLKELGLED